MLKSPLKSPSTPGAPYLGFVDLPGVDSSKAEAKLIRTLSTPPGPHKPSSKLRTSPVDLHRSVVLPDRTNQLSRPFAIFDVAKHPSCITLRGSTLIPSPLNSSHRAKLASKPPLEALTIECEDFGPKWKIKVKQAGGVTCGNVFDAIFDYLRRPMSQNDIDAIPESRLEACRKAFERRCREKPFGLPEVELKEGMRRVDYLAGKTMFGGIYLPSDTAETKNRWMLKLSSS